MLIFEFAVLYDGKKDLNGSFTELPSILVPPTTVLASDLDQARLKAARSIPEDFLSEKLDRVKVFVRPF